MRIVMIITDGREERRCYNEPFPHFGPGPADMLLGFFDRDDCELHVVSCLKRTVRSPETQRHGVHFHSIVVPQWGWLRSLYSGCVMGIRRKLHELKPDIVHGSGTERYCALAAAFSGYPNVVTVRGNMRSVATSLNARPFSYPWLSAMLERFALSRTNGVVCLSTYSRNLARSLNSRLWQIPNAVDTDFFNVPRCPDGKTLLCLANIVPYKNQIGLIEALDSSDAMGQYQVVFAGGMPDKSSYAGEFLAQVKKRSWCRYDGFADRTRVRELLQTAVAVIHPSLEDNCPMAILEAMAVGVPVAASGIGGIPDIIEDRRNGLLFDPYSPESIRQAVRTIMGEPELMHDLASRGKTTVVELHSPREIALGHLRVYEEVLARR